MPVERPTVPNAESDSNAASSSVDVVSASSRTVALTTTATARTTTVVASRATRSEMRRPKASTSERPRSWDHTTRPSTAAVPTLMPPLVPALPAPTNISTMVARSPSSVIEPIGTTLKPAVRGVMDPSAASHALAKPPRSPNVAGFVHSDAAMAAHPTTKSSAVMASVSRECSASRCHRRSRRCSYRSTSTGNPSPPTSTATPIAPPTATSVLNRVSESGYSVNPALVNAATAWNAPCQAARPQP
ncbi:MAG: hypothetical protein R2701_01385 [Acidimicrobiales bacterium]